MQMKGYVTYDDDDVFDNSEEIEAVMQKLQTQVEYEYKYSAVNN